MTYITSLKKSLTLTDLILLGIGATVGTGIFVLTGIAAAKHAGPAVSISYLIAGIACIFAGLIYAELATTFNEAGGAYSYSYKILGKFIGWITGYCLIIEYITGSAIVATGWSGYFGGMLANVGIHIPHALSTTPTQGGTINLPAFILTLLTGILLVRGTEESAAMNKILVAIKLGVIAIFLIIAIPHIDSTNWTRDFMPFGWHGVFFGATMMFFSYIGFDAIAAAVEESKNPSRDLPIGIIGSILICAAIYVITALALTGITPYNELNNAEPMAYALRQNGSNIGAMLLAIGAVIGMIAVLLASMYAGSRLIFAMARDGVIFKPFAIIHPRFATPHFSCIAITLTTALISGFVSLENMSLIIGFGMIFAFIIAAISLMVLRIKQPNLQKNFRCPWLFFIAPATIIICSYLLYNLIMQSRLIFAIIAVVGLTIYFFMKPSFESEPRHQD